MKRSNDDSGYDDEVKQETGDLQRAAGIKKLVFDTFKTNTGVLKVTEFIDALWDLSCYNQGLTFS